MNATGRTSRDLEITLVKQKDIQQDGDFASPHLVDKRDREAENVHLSGSPSMYVWHVIPPTCM